MSSSVYTGTFNSLSAEKGGSHVIVTEKILSATQHIQVVLKLGVRGTDPHVVKNLHTTFDSPKT